MDYFALFFGICACLYLLTQNNPAMQIGGLLVLLLVVAMALYLILWREEDEE